MSMWPDLGRRFLCLPTARSHLSTPLRCSAMLSASPMRSRVLSRPGYIARLSSCLRQTSPLWTTRLHANVSRWTLSPLSQRHHDRRLLRLRRHLAHPPRPLRRHMPPLCRNLSACSQLWPHHAASLPPSRPELPAMRQARPEALRMPLQDPRSALLSSDCDVWSPLRRDDAVWPSPLSSSLSRRPVRWSGQRLSSHLPSTVAVWPRLRCSLSPRHTVSHHLRCGDGEVVCVRPSQCRVSVLL
mmetsp:Transcript_21223/g.46133  ORF Transcript_21223/g.46133 Transcript_21223/m.46133 type:complete len:242 (+) Transcript_21223:673-1398(+)